VVIFRAQVPVLGCTVMAVPVEPSVVSSQGLVRSLALAQPVDRRTELELLVLVESQTVLAVNSPETELDTVSSRRVDTLVESVVCSLVKVVLLVFRPVVPVPLLELMGTVG
jgi:hypothetical protein